MYGMLSVSLREIGKVHGLTLGAVAAVKIVSDDRLLYQFRHDRLDQVRLKFFTVSVISYAVISTCVLRVCTGQFAPWGLLGIGAQAVEVLVAGELATRCLDTYKWALYALQENQKSDRGPEVISNRESEVIRGLCKSTALSVCRAKKMCWDRYVERDDVTPAEVVKNLQPHTLFKNYSDDPQKQIRILKKASLGEWCLSSDSLSLHEDTINDLMKNPTFWDLVIVQLMGKRDVTSQLAKASDGELLSLLKAMKVDSPDKVIKIVNCLPIERRVEFLTMLGTMKSEWFLPLFTEFAKDNQPKVEWVRKFVAAEPLELLSEIIKLDWKTNVYSQLSFLDEFCQRNDVTNEMAHDAYKNCAEIRYKPVRRWYKGIVSDCTLTKVLGANCPIELQQLMVELTYFEPEKQLRIFERFPLREEYFLNRFEPEKQLEIFKMPSFVEEYFLGLERSKIRYPSLAKATIDGLIANGQHSAWHLVIYGYYGRMLGHLWEKVKLQDLLQLNIYRDTVLSDSLWKQMPIRVAFDSITSEQVIPLYQKLEEKCPRWVHRAFYHILAGNTRLEHQPLVEWARKSGSKATHDTCKALTRLENISNLYPIFSFIDELGKRDDISLDLLVQIVPRFGKIIKCSTWDLSALSQVTLEKLSKVLDRCEELHIQQAYPNMQIETLQNEPLGSEYVFHTDDPVHDHSRFHYPKLHPETIQDLLKKPSPTVWDMAFCAREKSEAARKRLADFSIEELVQVALLHGVGENACEGLPSRCWDNHICWESSLAKVVTHALSGAKQVEFLNAIENTVWFKFALKDVFCSSAAVHTDGEAFNPLRRVFYKQDALDLPAGMPSHLDERFCGDRSFDKLKKFIEACFSNIIPNESDIDDRKYFGRIEWIAHEVHQWLRAASSSFYNGKVGKADKSSGDLFATLPKDVVYLICKKLYPADRARLGGVSKRTFHLICGEEGAPIWGDVGSIVAARCMHMLSKSIAAMQRINDLDRLVIKVLAIAWPKNFWPPALRPKWMQTP